jgi:signal transduction histidine kinase/CheY-like chemotaxis protein
MTAVQPVSAAPQGSDASDAARTMNRWLLDALDLVASVSITQTDPDADLTSSALLTAARTVLSRICPIETAGFFLLDLKSADFPLALGHPESQVPRLTQELEHQIADGVFAWALERNRPVIVPAKYWEGSSVLLHVLATRSGPVGMFLGVMPERNPFIPDGCQKLISIVLTNTAATLRSEALRDELRQNNKNLEAAIEQRTAELRQARDAAFQASRAKSEFLANMSHEIRTPMNAVLGTTAMLLESGLNGEQRGLAETIDRSGRELLSLINDILDFSKLEAGKLRMESIRFDLHDTTRAVATLLSAKAAAKQIDLRLKIDPATPTFVLGDPGRLRQVLTNLTDNALKFTEHGFVMVTLGPAPGQGFRFVIRDSGIGIPPEKQATIFEKFTQADTSTTRKYGGTGLGLAICNQLIDLMGGTITLESEVGRGSTFTVTIPFPLAPATDATASSAPRDRLPRLAGRVLLAEDYPANQKIAIWMLKKLGLSVDLAEDGEEALRKLDQSRYDLILMDCQMPKLDGYDATQAIRGRAAPDHAIPVIAMTASALPADRERCITAGMNDYISKPVQIEELAAVLHRFLPQTTGEDAAPAAG